MTNTLSNQRLGSSSICLPDLQIHGATPPRGRAVRVSLPSIGRKDRPETPLISGNPKASSLRQLPFLRIVAESPKKKTGRTTNLMTIRWGSTATIPKCNVVGTLVLGWMRNLGQRSRLPFCEVAEQEFGISVMTSFKGRRGLPITAPRRVSR